MKGLYVILLAAGLGKRFSRAEKSPKQLVKINGKPLLRLSVNTALSVAPEQNVILAHPPGMRVFFEKLCRKYGWDITLAEGGERRQDSVFNAFMQIENAKGIVLIHDSARPLASPELFKRIYEGAKKNGACIPVIKSPDTVKELRGGFVEKTVNRDFIGLAQTPQGFEIALLRDAFAKCDSKREYTDEAGLLESQGCKVFVVEGERHNLKLTFQEDLTIIKALIHEQNRHRD